MTVDSSQILPGLSTESLRKLGTKDLANLAKSLEALQKNSQDEGPQTDDELHQWIKDNLGYDIPRTCVCHGHTSPFQFIADIYFERVTAAIAMANRGGSKTMSSAIIHMLNSLYKPGCESMTVGAIEAQALRAYENLANILRIHGKVAQPEDHPDVHSHIKRRTDFKNGSWLEIVPGTIAAVNGPHPMKVHRDEIELMDLAVFQEASNMSMSKFVVRNGKQVEIKAQDWLTSTRKRAHGPMQGILDEIVEAEKAGLKPAYKLYVWCVFETARNVPNCRIAKPDLPEEEKCQCQKVLKGEWDDGSLRTFDTVCDGRLDRSQGFLSLSDIHKKFQEVDRDTWEAQQECSKPEVGGAVFKQFNEERFGIKWYEPLPENGPIIMGVDFGGTNPHAINWYQILDHDMYVHGINQMREDKPNKLLKAGTRVCFDEVYIAEIGNSQLAQMALRKEREWKDKYEDWKVFRRFADVAAKAARLDWAALSPVAMPTQYYVTRDIKEHLKTCNQVLDDKIFAVDTTRCKMFVEEAEAYHYPPKKPELEYDPELPIDDFNHCMSNFRYVMENLKWMESHGMLKPRKSLPKTGGSYERAWKGSSPIKSGAARYLPIRGV